MAGTRGIVPKKKMEWKKKMKLLATRCFISLEEIQSRYRRIATRYLCPLIVFVCERVHIAEISECRVPPGVINSPSVHDIIIIIITHVYTYSLTTVRQTLQIRRTNCRTHLIICTIIYYENPNLNSIKSIKKKML